MIYVDLVIDMTDNLDKVRSIQILVTKYVLVVVNYVFFIMNVIYTTLLIVIISVFMLVILIARLFIFTYVLSIPDGFLYSSFDIFKDVLVYRPSNSVKNA